MKIKFLFLLLVLQINNIFCTIVTKSNTDLITINDNATASPYPSIINISEFGPNETICKVTATLNGFTHTFPEMLEYY